MTKSIAKTPGSQTMTLLSRLLLVPEADVNAHSQSLEQLKTDLLNLNREEYDELLALAHRHPRIA